MGKSLIFSIEGSRRKRRSASVKSKPRKSASRKKKRFIAGAIKHKGSFTRYCNAHGHRGASQACIKRALRSGSPRRQKQAVLTRRLKNITAKRSRK